MFNQVTPRNLVHEILICHKKQLIVIHERLDYKSKMFQCYHSSYRKLVEI